MALVDKRESPWTEKTAITARDMYERELMRLDKIGNAISLPVGLVAMLVTALVYLLTQFKYGFGGGIWLAGLTYVFVVAILAATVFVVSAGWDICRAGRPYVYMYITTPSDFKRVVEEARKYYGRFKDPVGETEGLLMEHLADQYIECAEHNVHINDQRTGLLAKAREYLIYAAIPLLLSSFLLAGNKAVSFYEDTKSTSTASFDNQGEDIHE